MELYEDFWAQYCDGTLWQTVASYAQGIDFNNEIFNFATVTIPESTYVFPTDMRIRFMCDASGDYDYVYIDEVRVSSR